MKGLGQEEWTYWKLGCKLLSYVYGIMKSVWSSNGDGTDGKQVWCGGESVGITQHKLNSQFFKKTVFWIELLYLWNCQLIHINIHVLLGLSKARFSSTYSLLLFGGRSAQMSPPIHPSHGSGLCRLFCNLDHVLAFSRNCVRKLGASPWVGHMIGIP